MRPTRQKAIRECLRKHAQGLTRHELSEILGIHISNIKTAIKAMPDVYVDRWSLGKRNAFQKVYCAVHVPEDCPHPKDRVYPIPKTVWRVVK